MPENDPGSGTTPAPKTQGDAESDPLRGSEAPELLVGYHACECGHPGMRLLPDGVFHCPACGSEVLPIEKP
ncbi:MAG TPA: hypothetical protein VHH10_13200 [Rubrobacteraceae bacterium]|nr:hypothetical protein [Rubrobacteraceae bacterium]